MLLLMHFRSHPITCHIIHSHRIPALISLSSTSPLVCSASTHPQSNSPNITWRHRETQKFVTHRSPPLQNAIKAISAPRTRKTGTHLQKNPGQAGIGKKKKKNKSGARCMKRTKMALQTLEKPGRKWYARARFADLGGWPAEDGWRK